MRRSSRLANLHATSTSVANSPPQSPDCPSPPLDLANFGPDFPRRSMTPDPLRPADDDEGANATAAPPLGDGQDDNEGAHETAAPPIGDGDDDFFESQEPDEEMGRASSCTDISDAEFGDVQEDFDPAITLDDLLPWLPELRFAPKSLQRRRRPPRRQRRDGGYGSQDPFPGNSGLDVDSDVASHGLLPDYNTADGLRSGVLPEYEGGSAGLEKQPGREEEQSGMMVSPKFPEFGDGWAPSLSERVEAAHGMHGHRGLGRQGGTGEFNPTSSAPGSDVNRASRVSSHSIAHPTVPDELNWDTSDNEDDDNTTEDALDLKYRYREETWSKNNFTYNPPRMPFRGSRGLKRQYINGMPTFMHLFSLFWPYSMLKKIVRETNCYASEIDDTGKTIGGPSWEMLTVPRLKAFMAAQMYMGMKKQPNMKSYWQKVGSFFHCPTISKLFTLK
jgi:hypothetical protein